MLGLLSILSLFRKSIIPDSVYQMTGNKFEIFFFCRSTLDFASCFYTRRLSAIHETVNH